MLLPTAPAGPVVRGSVEQIHIDRARRNSSAGVEGPGKLRMTGPTDDYSGLVFRHVPAGGGYRVTIEGNNRFSFALDFRAGSWFPQTKSGLRQALSIRGVVRQRGAERKVHALRLTSRRSPALLSEGPHTLCGIAGAERRDLILWTLMRIRRTLASRPDASHYRSSGG